MVEIMALNPYDYDLILIDEAHVESTDVLFYKKWGKEHAADQQVKFVAMSATFPNRVNWESNYPITTKKIKHIDDLRKYLNPTINCLMFTSIIVNTELTRIAELVA